jgi:hypothetical protein
MKTAVVTFFDAYPPKSGAGVVVYDFFHSWPDDNKCLFQMSTEKIYKKKIINTKLIKNKAIFKILSLPILILRLLKYFNNSKKKILVIEGASWIFYSYLVIFFLKLLFSDIFIIYRSHNIEYEIRKKNSSLFIGLFTKYIEKKVFNLSNIVTAVSMLEQKKISKYYNVRTRLFPNSIRIIDFIKLKEKPVKKIPKKYILFCGSYEYLPNKYAIDNLINNILPIINKKNIYLVLTGSSNINFNNNKVINLGNVKRAELKFLYKNAICLMATLFDGYGTRVKIIESLILESNVISTSKGIEGINFYPRQRVIIANQKNKMISGIYNFMKFKKYNKIKNLNNKILKYYSMEDNVNKLFNDIYV